MVQKTEENGSDLFFFLLIMDNLPPLVELYFRSKEIFSSGTFGARVSFFFTCFFYYLKIITLLYIMMNKAYEPGSVLPRVVMECASRLVPVLACMFYFCLKIGTSLSRQRTLAHGFLAALSPLDNSL